SSQRFFRRVTILPVSKKSGLERLATAYYARLPKRALSRLNPIIEPAYAACRRIGQIALDLWMPISVLEDAAAPPLRIAGRGEVRQIFLRHMANRQPRIEQCRRQSIWRASRFHAGRQPAALIEADRCFVRLLARRGYVAVPQWVLFRMDVAQPWD